MTGDRKPIYKTAEDAYLETKTDLILKEGNDGFTAVGHHRKALRSAVDAVLIGSLTPTNTISEALISHQLQDDTGCKGENQYKCSCNGFWADSKSDHADHVAVIIQRLSL